MTWLKKGKRIKTKESGNTELSFYETDTIEKQIPVEDKDKELETIFNQIIDRLIAEETGLINKLNQINGNDSFNYEEVKQLIFKKATEKFKQICDNENDVKRLCDRFNSYFFGYYVMDSLLLQPNISDIKIYNAQNIRIKKRGVRMGTDVKFMSNDDYIRFVNMLCVRNKKNLSNINALIKFSDVVSNPLYRLRINITSELINNSGIPKVHFRLIPKKKVTLEDLIRENYMNPKQKDYLIQKFDKQEAGILFVGANGSGKTTGMNALLEVFSTQKSGLVIQETDELFVEGHPDFSVWHTIEENNEGMVHYGIDELANHALTDDVDLFVLGEVKSGSDAAALPMLAATGSQIMLSAHGNNEEEGLYKVGDYMKQATGYELEQCMRFLTGIQVVVYVKKYQICSISEVHGWDYEKQRLRIVKLDEDCKPVKVQKAFLDSSGNAKKEDIKTFSLNDFFFNNG